MNIEDPNIKPHIYVTTTEGNDVGNKGFVDQLQGSTDKNDENYYMSDLGVFYAFRDGFLSSFPDSFGDLLSGKMDENYKEYMSKDDIDNINKTKKKAVRSAFKAAEDFSIKVLPTHSAIFRRLDRIDQDIKDIMSQLYQANNQIKEINTKIEQILKRLGDVGGGSGLGSGSGLGGFDMGGHIKR